MTENRKLAAILIADVAGYSRLTGADEEGTLSRLRALRGELLSPTVALHSGRVVKRTGDGAIVEFRSVVEAVRCAIEVQRGMVERNAGAPDESRIDFRVGIHLGDVVEEADGDLMGDGVNVAARLEGICEPGGICLSEDAYRQVRGKLAETFVDLGDQNLKNIAHPVRAYALSPPAGRRAVMPAATVSATVTPEMSGERLPRPAIVTAVAAILENFARLIGALAERTAPAGGDAIPSIGDAPRRARRARDRRLRRAIIVAAIIALVAARIWRGHDPVSLPPPASSPATLK
jgi:class 3 adenylate cyclase